MEEKQRSKYIFELKDLNLELFSHGSFVPILSSIAFQLKKGESFALIGESGSGKSMTAMSIMQVLPKYIRKKCSGKQIFRLDGFKREIDLSGKDKMTDIRGKGIGMIFQDPNNSFNPIQRCGIQITEAVQQNTKLQGEEAVQRSMEMIRMVGLTEADRMYAAYPHELSGGQLQRLLIAMALVGEPTILIADEATSNLDKKASQEINLLLKKLQRENQFSLLYITHDMEEAKIMADRFILMDRGRVVQEGKTEEDAFFKKIAEQSKAFQDLRFRKEKTIENDEKILLVEDIYKSYKKDNELFQRNQKIDVLKGVDLQISKGQIIGLEGISGSGKSTLARIIMNLETIDKGSIFFCGKRIDQLEGKERKQLRKKIQMVYQNPFNTLNPRMSLISIVKEALSVQGIYADDGQRIEAAYNMLLNVGIEESKHKHFTYQLSGGQRQRVALARSIILQPELLILDESISSLDKKTQVRILDLLFDLKERFSLSYFFISHDQTTLKAICDTVYQLHKGKIK